MSARANHVEKHAETQELAPWNERDAKNFSVKISQQARQKPR